MSSADDFFAGGTTSGKFDSVGKTIAGPIVRVGEPMQQRDFTTGQPKVWDDGRPMMQLPVDVQTDERDPSIPDDDGVRALYIRGEMQKAVRDALRKAKAPGLRPSGHLSVTYTGDGTPKQRGMNGPKLYTAAYQPPDPAGADDFIDAQPSNGAAAVQQAAQVVATSDQQPTPPAAGQVDSAALQAALANLTPEQRQSMGLPAA